MNLFKHIKKWNKTRLAKRRLARKASYQNWINHYDTFDLTKLQLAQPQHKELTQGGLISLILVLDHFDHAHLTATMASVAGQIYQQWELHIVLPVDARDAAKNEVIRLAGIDPRIKYHEQVSASTLAGAYNFALAHASGSHVAILNPDGVLPTHALLFVNRAIQRTPQPALIYTDEDQINQHGERRNPIFKPQWNEYLLRSHFYLGNFLIYKKSLVDSLGGFREDHAGAEQHDLAFRCSEHISLAEISHIPFILYHAREKEGTVNDDSIEIGPQSSRKAVQAHLDRLKVNAQATVLGSHVRVTYELLDPPPKVSIIVPSRDRPELLKTCVQSILDKTSYPNYELIFVDNGTTDQDALRWIEKASQRSNFKLIKDDLPFNYSRVNNLAVKACGGRYVCLMNNDVEITDSNWLTEMVSIATQPDVGIVGARLLYPNTLLQHAGVIVGLGGVAGHAFKNSSREDPCYMDRAILSQEYSAVTAACLVTSKSTYERVGGLDEHALSIAFNDIDYCLKVREIGLKVVYTPYVEHFHHESASRGEEDTPEKKARFRKECKYMTSKWSHWLNNDPAYNPNLTTGFEDFSLATPPRINFRHYLFNS